MADSEGRHAVPVSVSFFHRPVWEVAQDLLGKILLTRFEEGEAAVRLTEVEAYAGVQDRACHAYGGAARGVLPPCLPKEAPSTFTCATACMCY